MTQVSIVPTEPAHVAWIAPRIREADRQEIAALAPWDADEALRRSVSTSFESWTGLVGDEPVCVFGLASRSIVSGTGVAWLLGTDSIERHAMAFLRRNKAYLVRCLELCAVLENWVDARHAVSIRWLTWLGFDLAPAAPFGQRGMPFHHCHLRRP